MNSDEVNDHEPVPSRRVQRWVAAAARWGVLVGVLVGLWIGFADPGRYAQRIVAGATPNTSRLSAAWIAAAGRGEAGRVWHDLALALADGDRRSVIEAGRRALGLGHTSGSDAMSGFLATMELIGHNEGLS